MIVVHRFECIWRIADKQTQLIYYRPVFIYVLILLESKWADSHILFATKCLLVILLIFGHFAFFLFFHDPQKNTSKFSVTYDFLEIGKINPQKEKPVFHDRKSKFLENTMKIQRFSDFSDHEVTRLNFWFLVSLHWWFFSSFFRNGWTERSNVTRRS